MDFGQDIIGQLATQHGLARVPLFRTTENVDDRHEILLDGTYGSFAISVGPRNADWDPTSWTWSANIPHHVSVSGDDVSVLRWDKPNDMLRFKRRDVLEFPREFYAELRGDRVEDQRTVVAQSMDLFRRIRAIVRHAGLEDARAIDAYLITLDRLRAEASGQSSRLAWALPNDADELARQLSADAIEVAVEQFRSLSLGGHLITAYPALAIRHASGAIFQEAHNILRETSGPDLFSYVSADAGAKSKRTAVHFTPPAIARAIAEQALRCVEALEDRSSLAIADFACGSGAFLIECVRALERFGYKGRLAVFGRDISPIAVSMARFAVGTALLEWPGIGSSSLDICLGNALDDGALPSADVVVMNPPFAAWQDLGPQERELLLANIDRQVGRPDLSMAFIERASKALTRGGALASLLPASLLETTSSGSWRAQIAERSNIAFVGMFDDHRLFSDATVRLGAIVLSTANAIGHRFELRAGDQPDAAGDAIRALRRLSHGFASEPARGDGWVIDVREANQPINWTLRTSSPHETATLTTIGDVFKVMQGVRSGCNAAFVLDEAKFTRLPRAERRYFRRAITSKCISTGRVVGYVYIFYPYDKDKPVFDSERQLRARMPSYFSRFLLPHRDVLKARPRVGSRWWELSEKRPGMREAGIVFASKYFAGPGGVALDLDGESLVLQGYGWIAQGDVGARIRKEADRDRRQLSFAYLAVLNSQAFFDVLASYSPPVRGGQRDMSPRFVNGAPLPNLTTGDPALVAKLAAYARARYLKSTRGVVLSFEEAEGLIGSLFHRRPDPPRAGRQAQLPKWIGALIAAGTDAPSRESRVQLLVQIQSVARTGNTAEIDIVLDRLDVSNLAEISLITLLRGTFAFSDKLANWGNFRDRVSREFARRGIDRKKVLAGLVT